MSNFPDLREEFYGEVPPPERIGDGSPGVSPYPANADHVHPFLVDPFTPVTLTAPWANAGGYRGAEIIKLGNVVFLRGVVNGGAAGNSVIATLSSDYWPSATEILSSELNGHLDMQAGGNLVAVGFVLGNFLTLNSHWFVG